MKKIQLKENDVMRVEKEILALAGAKIPSKGILVDAVPSFLRMSMIQSILLAFAGSLFLTVSAKINIPFWPVATTMQSFAVLFLGCALGARLAACSVALYLGQALLGFPVLSALQGPVAFVGPTAGYLLGFIPAAYIVGTLYEKGQGRTFVSAVGLFTLGALTIDLFGLSWIYALSNFEAVKTVWLSYQLAFILKTGLAATLLPVLAKKSQLSSLHHHHHGKTPPKP